MAEVVDWRKVRTGKDGQLFVDIGKTRYFIGECDTFRMSVSSENVDFQPVGSAIKFAVPTGHTVNVTLTETVIRDDLMISKFTENLANGATPEFGFYGKLNGANGTISGILLNCCIPDGEVDLMNITPGEIVKRAWTFRGNADPKILDKMKA